MYKADKAFLDRIKTGDESWFHYYEPESKSQSKEWKGSPKELYATARKVARAMETMCRLKGRI